MVELGGNNVLVCKMARKLLMSLGEIVKDYPSQFVKCSKILIYFSDFSLFGALCRQKESLPTVKTQNKSRPVTAHAAVDIYTWPLLWVVPI